MGDNVSSWVLKQVLWHLLFIIEQFGRCFASIWRTVAKIRSKKFFAVFEIGFTAFDVHFFNTLVVVLRQFDVSLPWCKWKHFFDGFEISFTAFAVHLWALWWLFCVNGTYCCQDSSRNVSSPAINRFYENCFSFLSNLVVILRKSDVPLPRYCRKRFFACFKTGFTPFTIHFWALWWLFWVDRTYLCKDTAVNVSYMALKPVLQHLPFISEPFGDCFASMGLTVTKIRVETFLRRL